MHFTLHDRYRRRAIGAEIVLLAASVLFLATTFADSQLYTLLGVQPERAKLIIGAAATAAFFCSLVLIVVDWSGKAARHQDAAERWTQTLALFRQSRQTDGSWPSAVADDLNGAYWDAGKISVSIPDKKFNSLKSMYYTKMEVSRHCEVYPGAPKFLLTILVRIRGSYRALMEAENDGAS